MDKIIHPAHFRVQWATIYITSYWPMHAWHDHSLAQRANEMTVALVSKHFYTLMQYFVGFFDRLYIWWDTIGVISFYLSNQYLADSVDFVLVSSSPEIGELVGRKVFALLLRSAYFSIRLRCHNHIEGIVQSSLSVATLHLLRKGTRGGSRYHGERKLLSQLDDAPSFNLLAWWPIP